MLVHQTTPLQAQSWQTNHLRKEVDYMLQHGIIEPSQSEWISPCVLVPKPDGTYRFCTDFRKVNTVTKSDSFPLPRVEDCIDSVGHSSYISKFDLLNVIGRCHLLREPEKYQRLPLLMVCITILLCHLE